MIICLKEFINFTNLHSLLAFSFLLSLIRALFVISFLRFASERKLF